MKRAEKLEQYAKALKQKLNQIEADARERGVDLRAMGIIGSGSLSDVSMASVVDNRTFVDRYEHMDLDPQVRREFVDRCQHADVDSNVRRNLADRLEHADLEPQVRPNFNDRYEHADLDPIVRQLQQNNAELEQRIFDREAEVAQYQAEVERLQAALNPALSHYSLQTSNFDRPKSVESAASSSGRTQQSFGSAVGDFSKFPEADRHLKESQAANMADGRGPSKVFSAGMEQLKGRLSEAEKSLKQFRDYLKLMVDQVNSENTA